MQNDPLGEYLDFAAKDDYQIKVWFHMPHKIVEFPFDERKSIHLARAICQTIFWGEFSEHYRETHMLWEYDQPEYDTYGDKIIGYHFQIVAKK